MQNERQWREMHNQEMFERDAELEAEQNNDNQAKLDTSEDDRLCEYVAFCVRDGKNHRINGG